MRAASLSVIAVIAVVGASAPSQSTAATSSRVNYKIVESRGQTRVVLISNKDRTEAKLRQLGRELKEEFATMPIVVATAFDDERAAKMYDRMLASGGSISDSDDRFYDHHQVAIYNRNRNTGHEQYSIFPNGADGNQIDVIP